MGVVGQKPLLGAFHYVEQTCVLLGTLEFGAAFSFPDPYLSRAAVAVDGGGAVATVIEHGKRMNNGKKLSYVVGAFGEWTLVEDLSACIHIHTAILHRTGILAACSIT